MRQINHPVYEFGPFCLDVAKRVLLRGGEPVPLTPKAFDMLLVLVQHQGQVLEKDKLMEMLWPDSEVEEANLPQNISALRKALGETPDKRRYITTIPGRGYKFSAEVKEVSGEEVEVVLERYSKATIVVEQHEKEQSGSADVEPGRLPEADSRARRRQFALAAAFLLGIVAVAATLHFWLVREPKESLPRTTIQSVAVLPFKPLTEDERDKALEIGMAEALIYKLSTVPQLIVRPVGVVRKYTSLETDPLEAGREMGVDMVLESTLQKTTDEVRVTARLLRVRDGVALWSYQSDEPQSKILELQDLLSEKVAASLVAKLSTEQRQLMGRHYTENAEAYHLYLKGRFFFDKLTPDGVRKSISYFQEAIDKDPNFALAYCGMCASYTLFGHLRVLRPKEAFPAARAALARAMELDESLSEAHSQMGFISLHYDYDWKRADKEFQRAIELNPNSPMAHHGRAFYLAAVSRTDEALLEIRQALELDPTSPHLNADAGVLMSYARRPDDAITQLRKTLEMAPDFPVASRYLARVYAHKRMDKLAVAEFQKSARLDGAVVDEALSAKAFAASGIAGYYRFELDRLKRLLEERYISQFDFARLYALLGDRDRAFESLEGAFEERNFAIPFLNVDPDFDNLRSDPRFLGLTQKLGLQ
ncbi:MAG: winged helix-turn-helix domain-containing protein [Acidobacteriota bacterium]